MSLENISSTKSTSVVESAIEHQIRTIMLEEGNVDCRCPLIFDGEIHRFSTQDGGRNNSNGWYIIYSNQPIAGAYGDWSAGISHTFCIKSLNTLSSIERDKHNARMKQAYAKRDTAKKASTIKANQKANSIWSNSKPTTHYHYLKSKGVQSHGLRQNKNEQLIVPLLDTSDEIHSLQFINKNGSKYFLSDGVIKGHFYPIGEVTKTICICEGYATAASVFETTGYYSIVAFNANNLEVVAKIIRGKYPSSDIIICGDNDQFKSSNAGKKFAHKAAKAINARLVLPQFKSLEFKPTDFNDLYRLEGGTEVKHQIEFSVSVHDFNFGENKEVDLIPAIIPLNEQSAPPFDNVLPSWLGAMVNEVTRVTETPVELAMSYGLSTIATCCQKKFVVSLPSGHTEPTNIWTLTGLKSGNRKSKVLEHMINPLQDWEIKNAAEKLQEKTEAEELIRIIESKIDAIRKNASKIKNVAEARELQIEISKFKKEMPDIPKIKQLWAQDVTAEKIGAAMAENGDEMSIFSAEGGIFEIMGGRYNNGIPNIDIFLQSHAGDAVRVDRGSRDSIYMRRPSLTMGLSPQPSVVEGLASIRGFRGRGLLARFLYTLPKSPLGYRELDDLPLDQSIENDYANGIESLLNINTISDEFGEIVPTVLSLERNAFEDWKQFQRYIETQMRPNESLENISDWASKLPSAALRIAALLHCVLTHNPQVLCVISSKTMRQALVICAHFKAHAIVVFNMMGADPTLAKARKVLDWIVRNRHKTFTARNCFQSLKSTNSRMADLDQAFDVLLERHYIFKAETPKHSKGGRPSLVFTVNPELTKEY